MTDADFLRPILAEPDADGPRLVYADWLEEQGQTERAEFIRVQCARAKLPADDPRSATLREREKVLLEQHRLEWSAPLSGLAAGWEFVRGFPDRIRIEARVFLARADALFDAVPLRHVEFHDVQNLLPRLCKSPHLGRLMGIKIAASRLGNAVAKALAHSHCLEPLQQLHLGRNQIGDDGAHALASAANFGRLMALDLSDNNIGPAGAAALAASPHLSALQSLNLRVNPIGSAGAQALLTSTRLAGLTKLNLAHAQLDFSALEPLAHAVDGPQFSALDLADNELGDLGVQMLVRSPHLA